MKFRLILLACMFALAARGSDTINNVHDYFTRYPRIIVNGLVTDSIPFNAPQYFSGDYLSADSFWMGNMYIISSLNRTGDDNQNDYYNTLACTIYMPANDSVTISDSVIMQYDSPPVLLSQKFYGRDTIYYGQFWCTGGAVWCIFNNITVFIKFLSDTATAIRDIQDEKQFSISPNPTTGLLNFTNYYTSTGLAEVKIYDLNGAKVLQQNFTVNPGLQTNPVDMGNLPGGVYLVEYTVNGNRRVERVVKL